MDGLSNFFSSMFSNFFESFMTPGYVFSALFYVLGLFIYNKYLYHPYSNLICPICGQNLSKDGSYCFNCGFTDVSEM